MRGANNNTIFAGGLPWEFPEATQITRIVCDPYFIANPTGSAPPPPADDHPTPPVDSGDDKCDVPGINIALADDRTQRQSTVCNPDELSTIEATDPTAFETVRITIVDGAAPVRCSTVDGDAKLVATRGASTDVTFALGNPWTFELAASATKILCETAFVAAPR